MADPYVAQAANPAPVLTDAQKAEADALFEKLKKEAEGLEADWVIRHVPAELQAYYAEKNPPPAPETLPV